MTGEYRGRPLEAVTIALIAVTVTSFCLRAYVRAQMVKAFGLDDWFMLLATISFILFATCVLVGLHYGTGRREEDVSVPDYSTAMQYWLYCYIWYCWTMIFSKISIAIFLLRIIVDRVHVWFIYLALLINVLSGLAFFFVTLLQCHPISYFWDKGQPDGKCIPIRIIIALTYLYSVFNIICDFIFAVLPIIIVRGLNMNRKLKFAIIPLLSMGCIASSAVIVRLAYVETFKSREYLYATTDIALWSTVEAGLAVTAGSLACVRPLFKVVIRGLGWQSDGYFRPSLPLPGANGLNGQHQLPDTIGTARKVRHRDAFNMASLFSRTGGDTDDGADTQSVGTASTTKLVSAGGIIKTSAFEVKVEEREPGGVPEMGEPGPSMNEDLGHVRSG